MSKTSDSYVLLGRPMHIQVFIRFDEKIRMRDRILLQVEAA